MSEEPQPVSGYIVHATRQEPTGLQIRPFMVGISDRAKAAAAVLTAHPDLDAGYHVEAVISITQENAEKLDLASGEIRERAEEILP